MKKFAVFALVSVLFVSLSFAAFADDQPVTLVMADGSAKGAVANLWSELFIEKLAGLTDNKLTVEYHGNSELGGDKDIITQMQTGKIDMCAMQPMNAVTFVPELGVFELPLVFAKYNAETIDKVVKPGSKFFEALNGAFRNAGFELIDYLQGGTYREMSSNVPARKLDDFKGIKIRTLSSEYQVSFWNNLGCEPVPLDFSGLYDALKNGTVEAEENAIDTQVNSKFYEVQKYLILTHHMLYGNLLYMTKAKFDSLAPAYQKAVSDAAQAASSELAKKLKAINDDALAVMKSNGVEVIELSDAVIDEMINAAGETGGFIRMSIGDELCDLLINGLEAAR